MSLRDFASHCLRRVAPLISNQHCKDDSTTKFIIDTTILGLIRNAISRDGAETVHSEAVLLLGEMVSEVNLNCECSCNVIISNLTLWMNF